MTTPTTGIRLVFTAFTARATKNVNGFTASLDRARVAAGLFVAGLAARNLAQTADQFTRITNQVRVTAREGESVEANTAAVLAIAQQTRSAFQATATTYTRLARVSTEFGATQAQVLRATEAIQKSFQIGGTSAKEAAGSAFQLSQALGSGRLNGDELRAVMEGNLPLARAIAREFGVGVGELKDMGAAGELTSDRVFKAILGSAKLFDEQFAQLGPTYEQSAEVLKNSFISAIGQINNALSGSDVAFDLAEKAAEVLESSVVPITKTLLGLRIAFTGFINLVKLGFVGIGVALVELGRGVVALASKFIDILFVPLRNFFGSLSFLADKVGLDELAAGFGRFANTRFTLLDGTLDTLKGIRNTLVEIGADQSEVLQEDFVSGVQGARERIDKLTMSITKAKEERDKLLNAAKGAEDNTDNIVPTTEVRTKLEDISKFALRAARDMQSAFADFLFDPFDEGIKGMLRGFVDIIRRMVAEALASNLVESLFGNQNAVNRSGKEVAGSGFASAISGLFGFRDGGGFTVGGSGGPDSKLAAFRVSPGERVSITKPNQSAGSAITIVNNVNVSGNGVTMAEVNAAVAQGNQSTMASLADQRRRGRA